MTKKGGEKNLDDDFPRFDHSAGDMHTACGIDKMIFEEKIDKLVSRIAELEKEFGQRCSCSVQALEEIMDKRELAYMVEVAKKQAMKSMLGGL